MSKDSQPRRRNISWDARIDELAKELAFSRRIEGGVSELLARLIVKESKLKRGTAHLYPRQLQGVSK